MMERNTKMKTPQHKHLMLRGFVNNPPRDTELAVDMLRDLVHFLKMKILQGPFSSYVNEDGNKGITGVVMIETSHIAFHIWDEKDPAFIQFDIYTCGDLDEVATLEKLREMFDFSEYEYLVYDRENRFELSRIGDYQKLPTI